MSVSIVWLNEDTANIYHFSEDRMEREVISKDLDGRTLGEEIATQLLPSRKVLVLSPGEEGNALIRLFHARFPNIAMKVVGCETLQSASDSEIASYAIKYFRKPVARATS